jgi:Flp pilus assembly CpaE family ATPase
MSKKDLTVLLIEDSPAYAELVQRWLSGKEGNGLVLNWTDSLAAGLGRLARGGVDLILLDLGLPDSEGLATFTTLKSQAMGVPIVVLTGNEDESLALQMVKDGAQDYLVKTSCSGEPLAKAIQCAIVRYGNQLGNASTEHASDQTRVIGVMGAKGGVGTTTVACNLAVELHRQTEQKALLADLDLDGGMVSFMMNTASEHSILDAVSNIHRLDLSWETIVAHSTDDLHIVRSPSLMGVDDPDAGRIRDVVTFIRGFYRWIVLDLGRLTAHSANLLDKVGELFLVTTTTVPSLYEAKRALSALRRAGVDPDRIRLIVNQLANTPDFSESELNQIFGIPAYAKLPDASQEFRDVRMQGRLPTENGIFRGSIAKLARKMAGLREEEPRRGFSLLSFAGKSRKIDNTVQAGA